MALVFTVGGVTALGGWGKPGGGRVTAPAAPFEAELAPAVRTATHPAPTRIATASPATGSDQDPGIGLDLRVGNRLWTVDGRQMARTGVGEVTRIYQVAVGWVYAGAAQRAQARRHRGVHARSAAGRGRRAARARGRLAGGASASDPTLVDVASALAGRVVTVSCGIRTSAAPACGAGSPDGRWLVANGVPESQGGAAGSGRGVEEGVLVVDLDAAFAGRPVVKAVQPRLVGDVVWTGAGTFVHASAQGDLVWVKMDPVAAGGEPGVERVTVSGASAGDRLAVVAGCLADPTRPAGPVASCR